MATRRTSRSLGRFVGWLLGLLAIIDVNLHADDALPPIVRPGNYVDTMADPGPSGPAPIIDRSRTSAAPVVDKARLPIDQAPNFELPDVDIVRPASAQASPVAPSVFDITPPIPSVGASLSRSNVAGEDPGFGAGTSRFVTAVPADSSAMDSVISGNPTPVIGEDLLLPDPSVVYPVPVNGPQGLFGAHAPRRSIEIQESTTDPRYDRVVDLFGANERDLIESVREVVEQTEVGVDTTDERWITVRGDRITWGGRIEVDSVTWAEDNEFQGAPPPLPGFIRTDPFGQPNYVEFRRLRLFAAGEGYGVFDYQLELEFAENNVRVKDAFVGMNHLPLLGYAMIGHFRIPIGLENRTSTRYIPFMERGLPETLLPGRELGLACFNQTPSQRATWSFGAFSDDIDEVSKRRVDDNQGTRAVARITWTPFFDEASLGNCFFHTGAGYLYTRPHLKSGDPLALPPIPAGRRVSFSARPEIDRGDDLLDTDTLFAEHLHTGNVELAYGNGPLTLQSEFALTSVEYTDGGTADLYGAYAYASWFLTGERRPYNRQFGTFGRVIPYENFWVVHTDQGKRAGWGAWEFAVRWSYLSFAEVNNQSMHDITLGLNWYWNPYSRMMINWIHPIAHNSPYATDASQDAHGDIISLRMGVDF